MFLKSNKVFQLESKQFQFKMIISELYKPILKHKYQNENKHPKLYPCNTWDLIK